MSWLFSRALVEAFSEASCLDGEPSAPSSGSPIQLAFCAPGKMTEFSRLSRFGMTYKPLTENRGAELLTSYLADFHAKTFPAPERARASTAPDQACGSTWQELSVKYDPATHSWRTHLCLWDEALQWSSVILPKWGMTRSGALFQHPTAERPINGTGSGLWPTPCADETGTAKPSINQHWTKNGTLRHIGKDGRQSQVKLGEMVMAMKWPTPCASDNRDRGNRGSGAIQRRVEKGKQIMLSQSVSDISGALNPQWVEWLMGWPIGWTDLRPLAMARFQSWLAQHSESSVATEAA